MTMARRTIKLLHVEDELSQRHLFAHHLNAMDDFNFEILYADAEATALESFATGGVEFVILDYHLRQGNGLHCLEQLRHRDAIVPIIAISGVATAEIAADLVQGGADDYIGKRDLTSSGLARKMRDALARVDAWRQRNGGN
jgi:two-component system, NarL family, sensor histidine kinase UhpB